MHAGETMHCKPCFKLFCSFLGSFVYNRIMLHSWFKCIIFEVFNSMQGINPACIQNMFEIKKSSCLMRDSSIMVQPKRNSTTFGWISFSNFGSNLWNDLPTHFKETTDFITFKDQLQLWSGPGVGVTKPIFSVPLFSQFFRMIKTVVTWMISSSCLAGVTAAELRRHLANMNIVESI